MTRQLKFRLWFVLLAALVLATPMLVGQEAAAPAQPAASSSEHAAQQPENPNAAIGSELSKESHEAERSEEHEENGQFKYSKTVKWFGGLFGLSPHASYFVSLIINFVLLFLFFWLLLRTKLPQMFRNRTAEIQKGIREAQAASADAAQRLSAIEARLAKLDSEIGDIRAKAEQDAVVEEAHIREAAEQDKHRIVEGAEAEIAAIARSARRDLKSFAASLAVDIAAKRIKVDERADEALVRTFVGQLGKDGKK